MRNKLMEIKLTLILLGVGFCGYSQQKKEILPAHAHNDYLHEKPLVGALESNFKSIEADVFFVGDSLFVAHDFNKITPGKTLRKLYLDPLKNIISKNNGSVYGNGEELILLVDFKNNGLETYKLLHQILGDYKEMLTTYTLGTKNAGAVSVIVSGNRPLAYMQQQDVRYAAYDGRISELDAGIPSSIMPLVSDNWNRHFKWRGEGEMPINEKQKLNEIVESTHKNNYIIRFWSTPEKPIEARDAVWSVLKNAGVDLIGTDNLESLRNFLYRESNSIFTHGPYLQNVSETGATIMFNTNKLAVPGVLIKSGNDDFKLIQNSSDGLIDIGDNIHKIRIESLEPGQQYEYKLVAKEFVEYHPYKVVYGKTFESKTYSFKTFHSDLKQLNFTVFCDIHDRAAKLAKYLDSNDVGKQDFYFLNGDIMGHIEEEPQIYSSFLDTCVSRFASEKPFFYARGNHETRGKFARELKKYLDLPDDELYYAQTIGKNRFIVLDGGEDKPDTTDVYAGLADFDSFRLKELEWLKKEVVSNEFQKAQFKIIIIHMPIIENRKNWYGMEFLAKHFGPVLKEAGIDLMISGHTHKNAWINSNKSGYEYPVMISSNNNYIEVAVNEKSISILLKDLDGAIVEKHEIEKE